MNKNGSIIVIEDDKDDQYIFSEIFTALDYPNEILYFDDGFSALEYLTSSSQKPFLIISDINMPKLNGFELREKIQNNEDLNLKCIPYLFFTTSAEKNSVITAYSKSVQGFFTKPGSYTELLRILKNIIEYWKDCHSPDVSS